MSVNNLIPVILIFLYLIIIYLLLIYKNLLFKKKSNNKIKDISPTLMLYPYRGTNITNLFNATIYDLIEKGYYKLEEIHNVIYIKRTKRDLGKLEEHEEIVFKYCNNKINNEEKLKDFELSIKGDFHFTKTLNKFYISLKSDAKNYYGQLDKFSEYFFATLISLGYFMQMIFFIYNKITLIQVLLASIALTIINFIITSKIGIRKINIKKEIISIIISFIIAIISCLIWIDHSTYNYILFHFLIALLTFMYPIFLKIILYAINTNTFCTNKLQKEVLYSLNLLKEKKKLRNSHILLSKSLDLEIDNISNENKQFFKSFKV